jgi:hypothetical protein
MSATPTTTADPQTKAPKRRLSSLDQLMLWGFLLSALFEALRRLLEGRLGSSFFLPVILLVCAAIIWTGWRWAFVAPIAFVLVAALGGLAADGLHPFIKPATHWGDFEQWTIELPLLFLVLFAAGAKVTQLIRKQPLRIPALIPYLISAFIGFAIGGNLLAILNR